MALGGRDVLKLIVDADSAGAVKEFDKLGKQIKSSVGDADKEVSGFTRKLGSAFDGLQAKSPMVSGIFNKMGVSSQQAASMIATAIPAAGVAAAAGIGVFAVKSIDAFQKTALAADKFRDASGLSIEDASKWIAVADDVGVGAGTMQSAFVKMEKAIQTNRAAFGDLVATTASGATDLSATFLNVITHLQGIEDPIQRANEASKFFGRGFAEVSEIITTDADKLKTALEGVSDAQIIDEAEVQKARDYQAAMDDLGDAFRDMSLAAGEALIPIATALGGMAAGVVNVADKVGGLENIIANSPIIGNLIQLQSAFDSNASTVDRFGGAVGAVFPLAGTLIKSLDGDAKNATTNMEQLGSAADFAGGDFAAAAADMDLLAGATGAAGAMADQLKGKWKEMLGTLTVEEATLNLEDSFASVEDSAIKAWEATATGAANADSVVRDHEQNVNDLKQEVVDYGKEIGGLPPERVTELLAMIDEGRLDEAEAALTEAARKREAELKAKPTDVPAATATLDNTARRREAIMNAQPITAAAEGGLNNTARSRQASIVAQANTGNAEAQLNTLTRTRNATINVQIQQRGGAGFNTSGVPAFQEGGVVPGPKGRAQLAVVHGGETVVPAGVANASTPLSINSAAGGASRIYNVTINAGVGDPVAIGRAVKQAIAAAERAGVN